MAAIVPEKGSLPMDCSRRKIQRAAQQIKMYAHAQHCKFPAKFSESAVPTVACSGLFQTTLLQHIRMKSSSERNECFAHYKLAKKDGAILSQTHE